MSSTPVPATSYLRAIETADQREQVLCLYQENRKTLRRGRLDIPRRVPPLSGHNLQLTNAAGSTLFMPICDVSEISDEGIACTKSICNYIYEKYGRFPGSLDAMHLMWLMQVHHLDTEYYDRFFRPGSYGPTHSAHLATWHR
jgi:hypothetical protein